MSFDELAKHMKSRNGGRLSEATDPDQMIAEAAKSARAAQRTSDLILGPILLLAGLALGALTILRTFEMAQHGGTIVVAYGLILGLLISGFTKIVRAILGGAPPGTVRARMRDELLGSSETGDRRR